MSLLSGKTASGVSRQRLGFATLWSPPDPTGLPVVVVFSPAPAALGWLASNLAARLPAAVYVCATSTGSSALAGAMTAVRDHAATTAVDGALWGVVAEDAAAPLVLSRLAELGEVSRLALVSPALSAASSVQTGSGADAMDDGPVDVADFPSTLLQFAREGSNAAGCERLATRLREAAVAVRAADYVAPADGWARRSRVRSGSARALDDLVAFFARGLGTASTFRVIPGWDLH
jgi:hypothetical protein